MSKLVNLAFVGPAGVGKTTLAKILESSLGYRRHALADALKVGQGYLTLWQLDLPIIDGYFPSYVRNVQRIMRGKMGIWQGEDFFCPNEEQLHWIYDEDIRVRDFILKFVNDNKADAEGNPVMRGLLQQYGTEVIRKIGAKYYPEKENTEHETWLSIVLSEARTDNKSGIPVVCDDVRYPHEADALRKNGWEIVRVVRENAERGVGITDENNEHSSEQMHTRITATATYHNDLKLDLTAGSLASLLPQLQTA